MKKKFRRKRKTLRYSVRFSDPQPLSDLRLTGDTPRMGGVVSLRSGDTTTFVLEGLLVGDPCANSLTVRTATIVLTPGEAK